MKFKKTCNLFITLILTSVIVLNISVSAAANTKILGKISVAKINTINEVTGIELSNKVTCSLPEYPHYYIQERNVVEGAPSIHIFGFNEEGLDFEIILDAFDLDGNENSFLEYVGLSLLIDDYESKIIKSESLSFSNFTGFVLEMTGNSFNNKPVNGVFEVVVLSNGFTCLSIVLIGHQKNEVSHSKILTEFLDTIKLKQNNSI